MNMGSLHLGAHLANSQPAGLSARAAVIAPLGKKEKNPQAGEKRRARVAAALGVAGGVGSVLLMKSAATGLAVMAGAPALLIAGAGLVAVMATSGALSYFSQRAALKRAGQAVPAFSGNDFFKSMFASKAALMAGGMTAVAAALPAALMLVVGSGVAAFGAGLHEYKSKRAQDRAAGIDVGRPTVSGFFSSIFKSKNAGKTFLISAGIGAVISGALAMFGAAPVSADHSVQGVVSDFNTAAAPVPAAEPPTVMPEMVERLVPEVPAPAPAAPQAAAHHSPALNIASPLASEVIWDTTYDDGVRQILHGSGVIETITPIVPAADVGIPVTDMMPDSDPVPAASALAPVHAAAAAPVDVSAAEVPVQPSSGHCVVSETASEIKIDCVIDVNATVQPGSGIEFRAAADGSTLRVGLSAGSEPMNAGEFLGNLAVPEAQEAYNNGSFKPQP